MTSVSFMDFLVDKLISLSSKMGDSSKLNGSSYLMSDSSKFSVDLLNGLMRDSVLSSEKMNPVMKQSLVPFGGYNYFNFRNSEKLFPRYLSDLIPNVYRHPHSLSESLIMANNMMVSHLMDSVLSHELPIMNSSVKLDSDFIKPTFATPISKTNMSGNSSLSKKKSEATMKCNSPNVSTLNKELISRKTKEINKRSKKRRRRQKKNQQIDFSSSASVSDDEVVEDNLSPVTSCMYLVPNNPKYQCTVAVSRSLHMTPNIISSFLLPVDSASDDDSEWESNDYEQCIENSKNKKSNDENIQSSSISSHAEPECADLKCTQRINCDFIKATTFISSFIVPLGTSSDDDSDWDSCEADNFEETPEIKFTGLLASNLCTPQTLPSEINAVNEDEETIKLKAHLKEVNKNWNKSNEGVVIVEPKSIKVSFAPDEVLVEVFPADVYERKGEWEIYATERIRFKRKIGEFEKVLSPCLSPEHRLKIYDKLHNSACTKPAL